LRLSKQFQAILKQLFLAWKNYRLAVER